MILKIKNWIAVKKTIKKEEKISCCTRNNLNLYFQFVMNYNSNSFSIVFVLRE